MTPQLSALIWEPDRLQASYLSHLFSEAGFQVRAFERYRSFQQALAGYQEQPLLVVFALDLNVDKSLKQCARLRQRYPLLCLLTISHHQGLDACLAAFAAGADDFLVKPFAPAELLARAQAHLQRTREILAARHVAKAASLQLGDLSLSLPGRKASYQGQTLDLKGREFELLHYLCQHAGRYLSREQIARRLWSSPLAPGSRKVDNLVLRLRKQLPSELQIRARYGQGYCMDIS